MENFDQLLDTWRRSASVMHIAHHIAASRYALIQRAFGIGTAVLGAVVASAAFIAASKSSNEVALVVTGLLSILSAIVSATSIALDPGTKALRHHVAAAAFQGLRREIEEDLVHLRSGETRKPSYEHLRKRWSSALEGAIPLPPKIHALAKKTPSNE